MSAEYERAVDVYLAAKERRERVEALLLRLVPGSDAGHRVYDELQAAERAESAARRVMHAAPGAPARG